MSFENSSPEPKKLYLDLLIKLDFIVAGKLYIYHDYNAAIDGMEAIITQALAWDVAELKETIKELDTYADHGSAPIEQLRPIHRAIKKYLNEKWFSELRLGIIPTSTIPGETPLPQTKAFSPNQSSRI